MEFLYFVDDLAPLSKFVGFPTQRAVTLDRSYGITKSPHNFDLAPYNCYLFAHVKSHLIRDVVL